MDKKAEYIFDKLAQTPGGMDRLVKTIVTPAKKGLNITLAAGKKGAGKAKEVTDAIVDKASDVFGKTKDWVKNNPGESLAVGTGAGLATGAALNN